MEGIELRPLAPGEKERAILQHHPAVPRGHTLLISLLGWDGFQAVLGELSESELVAVETMMVGELSVIASHRFHTMPVAEDVRFDPERAEVAFPGLLWPAIERLIEKRKESKAMSTP